MEGDPRKGVDRNVRGERKGRDSSVLRSDRSRIIHTSGLQPARIEARARPRERGRANIRISDAHHQLRGRRGEGRAWGNVRDGGSPKQ